MSAGARQPSANKPARIAALATLPVFHKLGGRRVLLAGASEGARWKAELLAAAGAEVLVLTGPGPVQEAWRDLARELALRHAEGVGRLDIEPRTWSPGDIAGCALAIGDFENAAAAADFHAAARAAGVPVNVIDNPAFCDFQFGAIVNRSPLVVSISTDGAAPVFGQAIRAKVEALLPQGLAAWAAAARDWRADVQARRPEYASRRRFWERFTHRAMQAPERAPEEADRTALMSALNGDMATPARGSVVLVGAGPGDPDLLTIKAMRALQSADVILYDDLVSAGVLELARREARRMLVGKKGHGPSCKQDDINTLMIKLARQGKRVVRLKGGDPLIFGRATEEIAACRHHGVPVEIIPGISAAQGAAAALGVSLTERRHARRVQFITGHGEDGALPGDINWSAIADAGATTLVYMPRATLAEFVGKALAAGLAPDTPVAAIAGATRPEEHILDATLTELPAQLAQARFPGPVLVMIGQVLRSRVGVQQKIPSITEQISTKL